MPDKRIPCGNGCLRCWRNKLKHGNKHAKHLFYYEILENCVITPSLPVKEKEPITNHMIRRMNRLEKRKRQIQGLDS